MDKKLPLVFLVVLIVSFFLTVYKGKTVIKLIVGLGNPTAQYADTRHNAGFWLIEEIARQYNISLSPEKKFHGTVGRGQIAGVDVRLLMPDTYMNRSGLAVAPMVKFFNIAPNELLVAHDELDIGVGLIKLKTGGGHGGHNGLRDIVPHTGADFHRLRIGIGRPAHSSQVSNFVLSKPSADDKMSIDKAINCALDNLPALVGQDFAKAQNAINSFKLP